MKGLLNNKINKNSEGTSLRTGKASPRRAFLRAACLVMTSVLLALPLASCGSQKQEEMAADYGPSAAQLAWEMAQSHPFRGAYSANEKATGEAIEAKLQQLGYKPERQAFQGSGGESANIIVHIKGSGFHRDPAKATDIAGKPDPSQETGDFRKLMIIGAHYDTPVGEDKKVQMPHYNGISDNASSVAALLLLAEKLKGMKSGYDVDLVFFGASTDNWKGARTYLDSLSEEQRKQVEGVFTLTSLYAGDKLYANAGVSSVNPDNRVRLRQPLYDLLDISVSYYTGLRLLDNQGGYDVEVPGHNGAVIYREFTLKKGDYTPFDEAGLPVVSIESGDYATDKLNEKLENRNPSFDSTGGQIRGTDFDSTEILKEALQEDILELRINAVVFLLKTYIEDGQFNAETK